jgi:hypothetical protein
MGMSLQARRKALGVGVPVAVLVVAGAMLTPKLAANAHTTPTASASALPSASPADLPLTSTTPGPPAAVEATPTASTSALPTASPAKASTASLLAWLSDGGAKHLQALLADMTALQNTLQGDSGDLAKLRPVCASLSQDVRAARAYHEFPDPVGQNAWTSSFNHFVKAATACQNAIARQQPGPLLTMADELEAGASDLGRFSNRLDALDPTS